MQRTDSLPFSARWCTVLPQDSWPTSIGGCNSMHVRCRHTTAVSVLLAVWNERAWCMLRRRVRAGQRRQRPHWQKRVNVHHAVRTLPARNVPPSRCTLRVRTCSRPRCCFAAAGHGRQTDMHKRFTAFVDANMNAFVQKHKKTVKQFFEMCAKV